MSAFSAIAKAVYRLANTGPSGVPRIVHELEDNPVNAVSSKWFSSKPDETQAPSDAELRDFLLSYANVGAVFVGVDHIARSAAMVPLSVYERVPVEETQEDISEELVLDTSQVSNRSIRTPVAKAPKYGLSYQHLYKSEVGGHDEIEGYGSEYALGTTKVEVVAHPLLTLLRHPNRNMTSFQLFYTIYAHLLLAGNAYFLLDRDPATGEVARIYVPQPHRMKPSIEGKNRKVFIQQKSNGDEDKTWELDDVIHFRWFNPASEILGMTPLRPVVDVMLTNIFAGRWNKQFFEKSARPDVVLETEHDMDDESYLRLVREWEKTHLGINRTHRPALLTNGLKIRPFTESRKDMEFIELRQMSWEEILSALGVHPALVGMNKGTVSADQLRLVRRMFWEDTLLPLMAFVAEIIEQQLFPKMHPITPEVFSQVLIDNASEFTPEDIESVKDPMEQLRLLPKIRERAYRIPHQLAKFSVSYNVLGVPALREKASEESQVDMRHVTTGIKTVNEIRSSLSLPPVNWGDVPPPTSIVGASMMRNEDNDTRNLTEPKHNINPDNVAEADEQAREQITEE